MKKKKLHFVNMKWRQVPFWVHISIGIIIGAAFGPFMNFFSNSLAGRIAVGLFVLVAITNVIWTQTHKNAFFFQRDKNYLLKIAGKKLEMNLHFLSEVWVEDNELHIRRINRVDSFPVGHLRSQDVDKLVAILREYEPETV